MIVNPGAWDYIRKAFNARPMGMFVPPNWIGLGSFAILGLLDPGFWVIGLGVELAYLWILGTNKRFQRLVDASQKMQTRQQWQTRIDSLAVRPIITPPPYCLYCASVAALCSLKMICLALNAQLVTRNS